jgi:hypothetical protein
MSLKELKDRRPESSRTKKVFIAKQKERLLEEKQDSENIGLLKCSGSSLFMDSVIFTSFPSSPPLYLGALFGTRARTLHLYWLRLGKEGL